jgi:hypothetical protein
MIVCSRMIIKPFWAAAAAGTVLFMEHHHLHDGYLWAMLTADWSQVIGFAHYTCVIHIERCVLSYCRYTTLVATQYGKVLMEGFNNKYICSMNLSLAFLKSKASSVVIISDACSEPFVESDARLLHWVKTVCQFRILRHDGNQGSSGNWYYLHNDIIIFWTRHMEYISIAKRSAPIHRSPAIDKDLAIRSGSRCDRPSW